MDIIVFIKDWLPLLLSVLTIFGGLWGYIKHDKKLKLQEKRLNDLQIKQIEKEEAKEKMAEMKANIVRNIKGNTQIRFVNAGKSNATNVRMDILTSKEDMASVSYGNAIWGPYDLINPQSYREEALYLCEGHIDAIKIRITWDDAYQKDRTTICSVPL